MFLPINVTKKKNLKKTYVIKFLVSFAITAFVFYSHEKKKKRNEVCVIALILKRKPHFIYLTIGFLETI